MLSAPVEAMVEVLMEVPSQRQHQVFPECETLTNLVLLAQVQGQEVHDHLQRAW